MHINVCMSHSGFVMIKLPLQQMPPVNGRPPGTSTQASTDSAAGAVGLDAARNSKRLAKTTWGLGDHRLTFQHGFIAQASPKSGRAASER